jgi:hypothetical protein
MCQCLHALAERTEKGWDRPLAAALPGRLKTVEALADRGLVAIDFTGGVSASLTAIGRDACATMYPLVYA